MQRCFPQPRPRLYTSNHCRSTAYRCFVSRRGDSSRKCASRTHPVCCSTSDTVVADTRTATVQVDLGYAAEQAVVRLVHPNSRLVEVVMQFPLGLVLENVSDEVVVTEITGGSAADQADCRVGDVVRACTAYTMQMTYPTMNLMFGGGGRPKLMKVLIPTEKVSFSKVMEAVRSNTVDQGGDGRVTLVLERVDETGNSSETNYNTTAEDVAQGAVDGQAERTSVFDPRIFNSTFE